MTRRRRLRARDRRAIVLGLVLVTPVAAYRLAVGPWMTSLAEDRAALATEVDLLSRELAALDEADRLPDEVRALRGALESARPSFLEGATAMAAAGALSREVTGFARDAGILIQEVEGGDAGDAGGLLHATSLVVRARGDLEGMLRFLHHVESGPRMLRVEELGLRPAGVNDGDLERAQLMSLTMVVTGYWLDPADVPPPAAPGTGAGG